MIVYLVSVGEYSDYSIRCVCSSMEKAEAARHFYNTTNSVEEFEIDTLPTTPNGMDRWRVQMSIDGSTGPHDVCRESNEEPNPRSYSPTRDYKTGTFRANFMMWARDADHAIKIANERRTQLIALGRWGEKNEDNKDWKEFLSKPVVQFDDEKS